MRSTSGIQRPDMCDVITYSTKMTTHIIALNARLAIAVVCVLNALI